MSSRTKMIGDIGTSVVVSEFLKHGINVLLPYDDNSSYDLVIYFNNQFYKIQVKTTERVLFGEYMKFETNITNPNNKSTRLYKSDEVDYFALYCIENEWLGLIKFDNQSKETVIRVQDVKNNQSNRSKFYQDYIFHNQVLKYFGIDYLKNNIIHNEQRNKQKRKKKTKICPMCGVNQMKEDAKTCRSCYLILRKTKLQPNQENSINVS